jgi:hypothetical protein
LDRIAGERAPDCFDIIIDDASHIAEFTKISFWHLITLSYCRVSACDSVRSSFQAE